jgi:hypothetical protein
MPVDGPSLGLLLSGALGYRFFIYGLDVIVAMGYMMNL